MPQACTVCTHPERRAIDKALATRYLVNRRIAAQHRLAGSSVRRHAANHLPAAMVKAAEAEDVAHAIGVMAELRRCFERVNLLFDACDRWLRDPENPAVYDIGPRAHEVKVTYATAGADGKPLRKKAPLAVLLARLEEGGVAVESWEVKHADPRELVLKTSAHLQGHLELLAKLIGQLDERPVVNLLVMPEWLALRGRIVAALAAYPEARAAVVGMLNADE